MDSLMAAELAEHQSKPMPGSRITLLPRGGFVVSTASGSLQFGIPPETLKDSIAAGVEVPMHYVVPPKPFSLSNGINVAEVEFPVYYNFFIKNRKTNILTTKSMADALHVLFHETMFGTPGMDCKPECDDYLKEDEIPDLEKECHGLTKFTRPTVTITVDDMLRFTLFDEETNIAKLDDKVSVLHEPEKDQFIVLESGAAVAIVPSHTSLPEPKLPLSFPSFTPPLFGVTTLGASTGFDPEGITSGVVLWVNKRGIMVDPPPHSSSILAANGISGNLIDTIFLTHCHADHDSGLFQKLMTSKKVTVSTTDTIMKSFLRKYSSVTGLGDELIRQLFTFRPVIIGKSMFFNGAEVTFHYSLHVIPCIGFTVKFSGKTLFYSADHCYDPSVINELYKRGLMKEGRRDFLLKFPSECDYILHEAGPAPIHTPLAILNNMPEEIKRKLYVYHCAKKAIPAGLKYLFTGVENTIVIDVMPPGFAQSAAILQSVGAIDLFKQYFSFEKAEQLLQMASTEHFDQGKIVIESGSIGEKFYIITSGVVRVSSDNSGPGTLVKKYTAGDFFGERSLLTGELCNATVLTETRVSFITIEKISFLHLFGNTPIPTKLLKLAESRKNKSWQAIIDNSILSAMSSSQKTQLESFLTPLTVKKGGLMWKEGDSVTNAFIIDTGLFLLEESPISPQPFFTKLPEVDYHRRESAAARGERMERGSLNSPRGTVLKIKSFDDDTPSPSTPPIYHSAQTKKYRTAPTSSYDSVDEAKKAVVYWGTGGHRCRKHHFAHPETSEGWVSLFGHGAMLSEFQSLHEIDGVHQTTVTAMEDSEVFVIAKNDLVEFLKINPSISVKVHNINVFIYAFQNVISQKVERMLIDYIESLNINLYPENILYGVKDLLLKFPIDRIISLAQNFSTEILYQGEHYIATLSDQSLRIIVEGRMEGKFKNIKKIYNPWEMICECPDSEVTEFRAIEPTVYLLLPKRRLLQFLELCEQTLAPSDLGSYICGTDAVHPLRGRVL